MCPEPYHRSALGCRGLRAPDGDASGCLACDAEGRLEARVVQGLRHADEMDSEALEELGRG